MIFFTNFATFLKENAQNQRFLSCGMRTTSGMREIYGDTSMDILLCHLFATIYLFIIYLQFNMYSTNLYLYLIENEDASLFKFFDERRKKIKFIFFLILRFFTFFEIIFFLLFVERFFSLACFLFF